MKQVLFAIVFSLVLPAASAVDCGSAGCNSCHRYCTSSIVSHAPSGCGNAGCTNPGYYTCCGHRVDAGTDCTNVALDPCPGPAVHYGSEAIAYCCGEAVYGGSCASVLVGSSFPTDCDAGTLVVGACPSGQKAIAGCYRGSGTDSKGGYKYSCTM